MLVQHSNTESTGMAWVWAQDYLFVKLTEDGGSWGSYLFEDNHIEIQFGNAIAFFPPQRVKTKKKKMAKCLIKLVLR